MVTPLFGTYVLSRDIAYEAILGDPATLSYTLTPAGVSWATASMITPQQWKDVTVGSVYAYASVLCQNRSGYPSGYVTVGTFTFFGKAVANATYGGLLEAYRTSVGASSAFNTPSVYNLPDAPCGTTTSKAASFYFADSIYKYPGGTYDLTKTSTWYDYARVTTTINY